MCDSFEGKCWWGGIRFPITDVDFERLLAPPTCYIVDNKRTVIRVPKKSSYHSFVHLFMHWNKILVCSSNGSNSALDTDITAYNTVGHQNPATATYRWF